MSSRQNNWHQDELVFVQLEADHEEEEGMTAATLPLPSHLDDDAKDHTATTATRSETSRATMRPSRVIQDGKRNPSIPMPLLLLAVLLAAAVGGPSSSCLAFAPLNTPQRSTHLYTSTLSASSTEQDTTTARTASASTSSSTDKDTSSTVTTKSTTSTVQLPSMEYYTPPAGSAKEGLPVVFLHGLLGNKRNFASLAKSLGNQLDTPRKLVGVDLRNHGDNTPESWQDDMSYTAMANDVLDFLDQHDLQQVVLVAHSMGGKVGQTLALQHPDRVAGLVVLDMAPVAYQPEEPHWQAVTNIISNLQSIDVDSQPVPKQHVDKQLQKFIPDPALRGFCMTNWNAKTNQWGIPIQKISHQLNVLAAFDIHHQDNNNNDNNTQLQYHGDVFFIHGGQSKFVRHVHMETIAQFFPNHMLTTIRGAGHWVHAEAPDDTIALLKRYLDR